MPSDPSAPSRYVGLDVHRHYLVGVAVDRQGAQIFGPVRVEWPDLERWVQQHLTQQDAVVFEMTANGLKLHDDLLPHVQSVTVVHPPHLALITHAQVKTDQKAALALARLHAAGLAPALWIPPEPVRQLRALVAQRAKMVRLATQAKNRLHAVLYRLRQPAPAGRLFDPERQAWWLALPVSGFERTQLECDWDTLQFAERQVERLTAALTAQAALETRVPLLVQLPGFSVIVAMTVLAAVGTIDRFASAKHLVGYAGLGTRVHDSGELHRTGGITKAGRRELRTVLVEAAQTAANTHPHWKAELARLEKRIGHNKAIVAIARKLLVAVWHVLAKGIADRFAQPEQVARKFMQHAYRLGHAQRPAGQTVAEYVREQLDRLQLGVDLDAIRTSSTRTMRLPPSRLQLNP
jgi:transposase